jgi:hypothetical protein
MAKWKSKLKQSSILLKSRVNYTWTYELRYPLIALLKRDQPSWYYSSLIQCRFNLKNDSFLINSVYFFKRTSLKCIHCIFSDVSHTTWLLSFFAVMHFFLVTMPTVDVNELLRSVYIEILWKLSYVLQTWDQLCRFDSIPPTLTFKSFQKLSLQISLHAVLKCRRCKKSFSVG